jgi:hypothetical protein
MQVTSQDLKRPPHLPEISVLKNPFEGVPQAERVKLARERGEKAKTEFAELTESLAGKLKPVEPVDAICCAGYLLVFIGGKPFREDEPSFGQHQAELLQALLLRHPVDFYDGVVGTPDQVEEALNLSKQLADARLDAQYADFPEDEVEFSRRLVIEEIRSHTQVIRGDFYPEQHARLLRPILERIDNPFKAQFGIAATTVFDLLARLCLRIEDRLNVHVHKISRIFGAQTLKAVAATYLDAFPGEQFTVESLRELFPNMTDSERLRQARMTMVAHSNLRLPAVFTLTDDDLREELEHLKAVETFDGAKSVLNALSITFGELADKPIDHIVLDNPVWIRPFIRQGETWILPVPTTVYSYHPDIFRALCDATEQLKTQYEDTRAIVLENKAADLLGSALPKATVSRSVKWHDPETQKDFENDVVIQLDGWLLLVEAKSGEVTASARRGSFDRLKREIRKLMLDPAEQSARFAAYLTANREAHKFICADGSTCEIDSRAITDIIRLNVTSENIGNLNARSGELIKAGLVPEAADLPPTMGVGSLDLLVDLLGSPSAIVHYLWRRKSFEANANYVADELDLIAYYLKTGFNIGEQESDGTFLMIYGYSRAFDIALTQSRDKQLGAQISAALTPYWLGLIVQREKDGGDRWLSDCLQLRNVPLEQQSLLEKPIRHGVYQFKKKGLRVATETFGPKVRTEGAIALVRAEGDEEELAPKLEEAFDAMAAAGIAAPLFLMFSPPVPNLARRICIVKSKDELLTAAKL